MDIGDRIHCGHNHLRMEEVKCHPAIEMSEGMGQKIQLLRAMLNVTLPPVSRKDGQTSDITHH